MRACRRQKLELAKTVPLQDCLGLRGGPCDARERSLPHGYRRGGGLHLSQEQRATRGRPQDLERLDRGPGFGGRRIAREGLWQPLRLRLIRALLQAAEDPERDFLLRAEKGLPVGILEPLPRTPHVFEEQEKWPLDSDPWEPSLAWVRTAILLQKSLKRR